MDPSVLDDASASLMIQLQIQDLEDLIRSSKGKHRQGETPDSRLALAVYKSELESLRSFISDRCMSKSIAQAVKVDGELIYRQQRVEDQATRDREIALNLDSHQDVSYDGAADDKFLDEEFLGRLEALNFGLPDDDLISQPESSSWAASRFQAYLPRPRATCISCMEEFESYNIARCPCSHEFCSTCLINLFTISISDESLYPPRCCRQVIPLGPNKHFLPPKLIGEFLAKGVELGDPNRTYCHDPACSTYIPAQLVRGEVGQCPRCRRLACVICKGPSHEDDCPRDHAAQEVLRIATENGWQRCYSCRRIVELDHGCNHMTCRCGAHFCYLCGERWKTCSCEQWNEDRLLARAAVIVDRGVDVLPPDAERRAHLLERARQNLVENHECGHATWRSRRGTHRCEECHDHLPFFIFECAYCRTLACRRCRYNRL